MSTVVSIVTPTLTAMKYLGECIESVERQKSARGSIEHIIVDGGSTDGTVELAQAHGLRVLQGKDKGIFDAINKGSFAATGYLIGFLGADDKLLEGALEEILRCCDKHPNAAWMSGGVRLIDAEGKDLGETAAPPSWLTASVHSCLGWCCIHHMATYITRDFFAELGGFDLEYSVSGDYEMFCRARSLKRFARIGKAIACNRRTGANFSMVHRDLADQQCLAVRETYGPKAGWQRYLNKMIMKGWVYGLNPGWAVRKYVSAGRFPFGVVQSRLRARKA
jgi:glycosyltransferase involved in cell wall biosynthesis